MTILQKRYLRALKKYLTATTGSVKMPYRAGDPTIDIEARIETSTAKAYLIEPTMGTKEQVWLPKSQTVQMGEPDDNGNRIFTVTDWWYRQAGLSE
jgi:hypothetical protein